MGLMIRRAVAWFIDFLIVGGLVSLFYFCASVFFLDSATMGQGELMLICALICILFLTVYVPTKSDGQTLGDKAMQLAVRNKDHRPRTYMQSFVRECVLKFAFAPFFLVFSLFYFVVNNLLRARDPEDELLHDYFLKTEVREAF